jgi:hypothetical protein
MERGLSTLRLGHLFDTGRKISKAGLQNCRQVEMGTDSQSEAP